MIISQIVPFLLINYSHVTDIGLMSGKMGGVLFFMSYARKTGIAAYSDYCDELIEDIYGHINAGMTVGLYNGLSGIGWAIEFMLKNGLAEGDSDELLVEIDNFVMEHNPLRMSDRSLASGLAGILFYVVARLKSHERNNPDKPFDRQYLASLKTAIRSKSFSDEDKVPLGLVEEFDDILLGKVNYSELPLFPDFMLADTPEVLDDMASIPIGIHRGLTGYAIKEFLK